MSRRTVICMAVISALVLLAVTAPHYAQDQKTQPPGPTGLEDKVVIIWANEPVKGGVLEKVHVRRLGSRDYLVGRIPDPRDGQRNPQVGKISWYPIDSIYHMIQFDTVDEAKELY